MKALIILLLSASALAQVSPVEFGRKPSQAAELADAASWRQGKSFLVLESTQIAAASFDTYTTLRNLDHGCLERNPLLGSRPSTARVIAFESAWTGGEILIAHVLRKKHHGRIAAMLLGESVVEHGVAGGLNSRQSCF